MALTKEQLDRLINEINDNSTTLTNSLQQTAFGELNVAEVSPYIQAVPVYNLIPANFREYTALGGSTGAEDKMFTVQSGTSAYGYGAIQSFRALNYRTGQGGLARFTFKFHGNAANSQQGVGLINLSDELSFGYNGTTFGIWYRTGGYAEVRTITVTGAAGGSENLTLTLNGTGYTIPLTSGTVQKNAAEIADWLNANQSVWDADQIDDTVIISAKSDGAKSGTYSFSSSTATGTIAQNTAGVTKTSTHIPQNQWNEDKAYWLNTTKGNVAQIKYQYLGFGAIKFYLEYPETGTFKLVHTIKYANANDKPSITNPSLRLGLYAFNANIAQTSTSTTNLKVQAASFFAASEGPEAKTRNVRGASHTQSVGTSFTNVLTIRNRRTYNGYINQVEVEPKFITIANESNKASEYAIIANPVTSAVSNFQTAGNNIVIDVDKTANTVTGGNTIISGAIAPGGSVNIDLDSLRIRIPPSLRLCVAVKNSGTSADVSCGITWYEDLS